MLSNQIIRRNAESKKQVLRLLDRCQSRNNSSSELLLVVNRGTPAHLSATRGFRFSSHSSKSSAETTTVTLSGNNASDYTSRRPMSTAQELPPLATTKNEGDGTSNDAETNGSMSKTSAYLQLGKARLSGLVVTTTLAGFIAAGGPLYEQAPVAVSCVVGTALCSFSAAAMNQIYERDRDSMMKRTQKRPMVTGALTVHEAKLAAALWGVGGTTLLIAGTDPVTALLGVSNIGLYAGVYTYMKPRSVYNTWVGAVVGAIPPVMGWTAATSGGLLDLDAIILGSTLYYWQLPHFFALSYMYRVDYERGGFQMLSSHEVDGERTSAVILRNATYLSALPFLSTFAGVTSNMFMLEGIALNSYALWVAYKFRQERTNANARKVFLTSLWYLPTWLVLFLLHSKVWDEDHDRDVLRDAISKFVHSVRDEGRKMCIHERVLDNHNAGAAAANDSRSSRTDGGAESSTCPLTLSKKAPLMIQSAAAPSALLVECEASAEEKIL